MNAFRSRRAGLVVALGTILVAASCSSPATEPPQAQATERPLPSAKSNEPVAVPSESDPSRSGPLTHFVPEGEQILGYVDNRTEDALVAEFEVAKPVVAVYIRCEGSSQITLKVKNHGNFPLNCSGATVPSLNEFALKNLERSAVSVEIQGPVRWSATVTALTTEQRKYTEPPEELPIDESDDDVVDYEDYED
ncbi:hypothetical protein [Glutamicibacter sp. PS]|uniref:hypothetical protein n=1 Tax=Glutamicibacter sp. PS TaxID=3075634 RepID=UPI002842CCE4|nr:hypothetical protein [Glutamicibacter sp. PS]MDR4533561.1 hypothetical protein [Glutamicibacter sp. PS]